jgi:hypothetical protein
MHAKVELKFNYVPVLPRGPASSYVVGRVQEEEGRRVRGSEGRPPRPVMRRSGADATREEEVATDKMMRRGVRRNPRGGGGRYGRDDGEGRPPQPARGGGHAGREEEEEGAHREEDMRRPRPATAATLSGAV